MSVLGMANFPTRLNWRFAKEKRGPKLEKLPAGIHVPKGSNVLANLAILSFNHFIVKQGKLFLLNLANLSSACLRCYKSFQA